MQQLLILAYEKAKHDMERGIERAAQSQSDDRVELDQQLQEVYEWVRRRERLDWLIKTTENGAWGDQQAP